jgi:phosphinothricin acetyltransferase
VPIRLAEGTVTGWFSVRSFYGRPTYHATAETALFTAPGRQRRGIARALVRHGLTAAPMLGLRTLLAFVFGHNAAGAALFRGAGFYDWGRLPQVAGVDGVARDLVILGARVHRCLP